MAWCFLLPDLTEGWMKRRKDKESGTSACSVLYYSVASYWPSLHSDDTDVLVAKEWEQLLDVNFVTGKRIFEQLRLVDRGTLGRRW